jgi:hypothetical protein
VSPAPLQLAPKLGQDLESLGRVLLQFYRAVNLLYRRSVEGNQPEWVSRWLDQGKPRELIELQRSAAFKSDLPRVIRPDLLLTDDGMSVTELDSVPGGIGLTAWLNEVYAKLDAPEGSLPDQAAKPQRRILGGAQGMLRGFADVFGSAPTVHIVISEESSTYRPEMEWVAGRLGTDRFKVQSANFSEFREGDAVYRFFELFDVPNVPAAGQIFRLAEKKQIRLTPPPHPNILV